MHRALATKAVPVAQRNLRNSAREFSTKKPVKKSNSKYSVVNVKTSLQYLFDDPQTAASSNVPVPRRSTEPPKSTTVLAEGQKSQQKNGQKPQSEQFGGFESKKNADNLPIPKAIAFARPNDGELTAFKNQMATVSYLFANKGNDGAGASSRRRTRKREPNSSVVPESVSNETLKLENTRRSILYLFGAHIQI